MDIRKVILNKKDKLYFPNLKLFLQAEGISFTDFVKEVANNQKIGKPLSEKSWHNATSINIGVSQTSINKILSASKTLFDKMEIKYNEDVLEVKSTSLQQSLFEG